MADRKRACGHPLGNTRWCPDCELAEARASGEFRTSSSKPPMNEDRKSGQEPFAWVVMDEENRPHHVAGWRQAAHDHISDAISEHGLTEAAQWRVVAAYDRQRIAALEELLTSAHAIALRQGVNTAWERFAKSIEELGVGSVTARTYRSSQ